MSNINLLPQNIKIDIRQAKRNRKTIAHLTRSLAILALVVLTSALSYVYINQALSNSREKVEKKISINESFGNLESEAASFSERVNTITKILNDLNHWPGVLEEIKNIMPSDAYLSTVSIDADLATRSKITGFANSKKTVATLRSAMEDSDKFEYVDIESSNIVVNPETGKEVENFVITFSLTRGALDE
jgi:Tfp pilus assembly protein PilN